METAQHKTVNRAATTQPAAALKLVQRKVQHTLPAPAVQASLKVSTPHDPEEKEAEHTAKKVMRKAIPESRVVYARNADGGGVFRQMDQEEEKDKDKHHKQKKLQAKFLSPYISRFSAHGLLQRKLEGQADVSANVSADIHSSLSEGSPLPLSVRRFMEPRFNADFSRVRMHDGDKSAKLNNRLSARAFTVGNHIFFGKNAYQPHNTDGKELIAHELTHTIQQGGAVQRSEDVSVTSRSAPKVQRSLIGDALDYIADKANYIPGFRMFTIVLGVNPINMSRVERSAANVLRAVIEFIPGGALITQALDNYGIFDKIGNWVSQQLATLGMVGSSIKTALMDFLHSLSWTDIFHPGDVWDRAKRIFTDPIDRIKNFLKGLVSGIVKFIKDAILRPLARLAQGTRGYDLLKAVLGYDPITGDPVPRNADTLIGGFMKLIGQEAIWDNLKKAKAIPRAWAWFQGALAGLLGFVRQIPTLFIRALQALELIDIVLVPRAFAKVAAVFGGFIGSFIHWAGNTMWTLLQIIFEVVAPGVMPYLHKAAGAFRTIIRNPIGFIHNLVRAGKLGFMHFAKHFLKHLQTSLIQWLTGAMAGAGIYIPQALTLREIIKFVLSVLGLTWQNIRQKLVRVLGETTVKALETGLDIVVTLVREGPAAAWEKIKEQLSNLKEIVIEQIISFVNTKIVQSAITKLLSMLTPAGAFIQAIIAIYNTIMFFIERLRQIIQVATAFINSIAAIAAGVITTAANRVEDTLAGLLTLAISFLARLVGLGKVSEVVTNIINKIRAPIDKALDKVVDWIVTMAKKAGTFFKDTAAGVLDWWKEKTSFSNTAGESHTLSFDGTGDNAKLMIASTPTAVEKYLDDYPDKDSADYKSARAVLDNSKKVIFDWAKKTADERARRSGIKNELAKISAAFAKLAGEPPTASDYPQTTPPHNADHSIEYLVGEASGGSIPGKGRDTGTPGWAKVYDAGLTTVSDKWVQMHIISEKLGGKGEAANLISAPNSVNSGYFRSFELSTASLAKASSGRIKNVVWVKVAVEFYNTDFAKRISGKSGLYFWKGRKNPKPWLKNETASLQASVAIPKPDLKGEGKISLNMSSKTDLSGVIADTGFIRDIQSHRYYSSKDDFRKKMLAVSAGYTGKVDALLGNSKVVLNN